LRRTAGGLRPKDDDPYLTNVFGGYTGYNGVYAADKELTNRTGLSRGTFYKYKKIIQRKGLI